MYKLYFRKDASRSLKKIKKSNSKSFVSEFLEIFEEIQNDPYLAGEPYSGSLQGFYKYVHGESPEYRIIFSVYEKDFMIENSGEFEDCELSEDDFQTIDGLVDIIWIKTREDCNNLYKQKSKYFQEKVRG